MRIEAGRAEGAVAAGARAARATDTQRLATLYAAALCYRGELVGVEGYLKRAEGVGERLPRIGRAEGDVRREAAPLVVGVGLPRITQKPSGDLRAPIELGADEGVRVPHGLPRPVVSVAPEAMDAMMTEAALAMIHR